MFCVFDSSLCFLVCLGFFLLATVIVFLSLFTSIFVIVCVIVLTRVIVRDVLMQSACGQIPSTPHPYPYSINPDLAPKEAAITQSAPMVTKPVFNFSKSILPH